MQWLNACDQSLREPQRPRSQVPFTWFSKFGSGYRSHDREVFRPPDKGGSERAFRERGVLQKQPPVRLRLTTPLSGGQDTMSEFGHLLAGFSAALTLKHLTMCFLGVLMGQMVGVLPGIGPAAAIALLLPLTFGADPTSAIILFAGIYYGSQYGGTLTSVLVSVPGESSTVMTTVDGYQMALQGRAGAALGIAAIGSFIAGTLGTLGLTLLAPPLAQAALAFGPPEYFALVVLGLTALAAVGSSVLKGLVAGVAGLLIGTIGIDPQNGIARFTFDQTWLLDGVEFIVLTVALFGVGEVVASCALGTARPVADVRNVLPTREDWRAARLPI